ncbi:MAG TPA: ATP-dependent Clp protease proteolytic subunit [Acidimicrobiales bacterium]|nr:ATP-dependent Clp protease proteolytic subunit [Acidimicrobiales bacterium]
MTWLPNGIEGQGLQQRSIDLPTRLLDEHIVFLQTPIDDQVAAAICLQLIWLEFKNADRAINLYINSPGGDITALFAIYDTMQYVKNDISVVCLGQAASAAAVLLSAGTPGLRYALPHSRIMLHQPYGGVAGQASDIEIQAKEILRMREEIDRVLAHHTGQPMERISKDTNRDFYLSADEAKEYGIIDEVISNRDLAAVPQAAGVA